MSEEGSNKKFRKRDPGEQPDLLDSPEHIEETRTAFAYKMWGLHGD
jgi:hypothetical protein